MASSLSPVVFFQFTTSQGGRRQTSSSSCVLRSFNSRPHKEVDILSVSYFLLSIIFQFTTSQGGRLFFSSMSPTSPTFQFTTSQGGRRLLRNFLRYGTQSFNSRPHKEVDAFQRSACCIRISFNSRPHKEVDQI